MTDEKLIEEAARLIDPKAWELPHYPHTYREDARLRSLELAESVRAVFEKAHAVTERHSMSVTNSEAHAPTDAAAEREVGRLAIERVLRACMLTFATSYEDAASMAIDKVLAAGFRRSEVPEPSAEPKHDKSCAEWCNHCTVCGVGTHYGSQCPEHYQNQPQSERFVDHSERYAPKRPKEPQGEPSDAHESHNFCDLRLGCIITEPTDEQARAVVREVYGPGEPEAWQMDNARAALRAAGEVTS